MVGEEKNIVLFSVISSGASATTWLSRFLNAHPDIVCLHGFPAFIYRVLITHFVQEKMEDITSDFSSMQKFFSFIANGELSITEDMKKLYSRKIRKRSDKSGMTPEQIFFSWKEKWRKAFLDFISENKKMWSLYKKFYQLDFI